MSFSEGENYGYDMIYSNPMSYSYSEYNNATIGQPQNHSNKVYDNHDIKNIYSMENDAPQSFGSVYDYLDKTASHYKKKVATYSPEMDALKRKLVEFQHKNDMLIIFIIYLTIIIFMQYSYAPKYPAYGPSYPPFTMAPNV